MTILSANKITKLFGKNKNTIEVLKGVDFTAEKSDFISILGKSGSGKSTLLYILSGLEKPTSGEVIFKGKEISKFSDSEISKLRRKNFGFIFQFYNLLNNFKAIENIRLPLEIDGLKNNEINKRIEPLVKYLEIENVINLYPYQMSGGQQQRVAIARALAINPDIIFADEPTGNLDSKSSQNILELLKSINEKYGTVIIMVTHDKNAASFGNKTIELKDGLII